MKISWWFNAPFIAFWNKLNEFPGNIALLNYFQFLNILKLEHDSSLNSFSLLKAEIVGNAHFYLIIHFVVQLRY